MNTFSEHRLIYRTLSSFGLTKKPSARQVRAAAQPQTQAERNIIGNAQAAEDEKIRARQSGNARAIAERRLKAMRPDLYLDESALRDQAMSRADSMRLRGKERSEYIKYEVNSAKDRMRRTIKDELERIGDTATREIEGRESKYDRVAGDRRSDVQRRESVAREILAKADPATREKFSQYVDFLAQINDLTPEERTKLYANIQTEAEAAIDPYFKEEEDFITREKSIRQFERDYLKQQRMDAAGKVKERGLEDINLDTSDVLSESLDRQITRGIEGSGLERTMADKIIEARNRGAGRIEQDFTDAQSLADRQADLQGKIDLLGTDKMTTDLGRERNYQVELEKSDIMSDLERFNYLITGEASATPMSDITKPAPKSSAQTADPVARLRTAVANRRDVRIGNLQSSGQISKTRAATLRAATIR